MSSQSTAIMLAQMLQGKKSAPVESNSLINDSSTLKSESAKPHQLISKSVSQANPQLSPNLAMEQMLTNILGASLDKKSTPME